MDAVAADLSAQILLDELAAAVQAFAACERGNLTRQQELRKAYSAVVFKIVHETEPATQLAALRVGATRMATADAVQEYIYELVRDCDLPYADEDFAFLLENLDRMLSRRVVPEGWMLAQLLFPRMRWRFRKRPLPEQLVTVLAALRERLIATPYSLSRQRKLREDINAMLAAGQPERLDAPSADRPVPIEPGEAWGDRARDDLAEMPAPQRGGWLDLLEHCQQKTGAVPSPRWLTRAAALRDALGDGPFRTGVLAWLPLVDQPRTIPSRYRAIPDPNQLIVGPHAELLKGLAWCCSLSADREMAQALRDLAVSSYRKLPGMGARAVKIGNAAVKALAAMPDRAGLEQLAVLRHRVKASSARLFLATELEAAAARAGTTPGEIEELAVPDYGLSAEGVLERELGTHTARLTLNAAGLPELSWHTRAGTLCRSVPAAVRREHAGGVKELREMQRGAREMVGVQRTRLDGLYLERRNWSFEHWRQRYIEQPVVGSIARRLIWRFVEGNRQVLGIWREGRLVDADDRPLELDAATTRVELWHPIGSPVEATLAWRAWLSERDVTQPFKQAHREVYLLTDAERSTATYSNRFAAHIIRQHQLNGLCTTRGWRNALKLMVDDEFPPTRRLLPAWSLKAELWTDAVGDEYAIDTNEAGVYHHLATDQVRFYGPNGDQPLPLTDIPPLVFSEIMRDVDLFVGVASVGNDPAWADGGPGQRHRDYWSRFAFGDLSATAETRREVLATLVPRLKIADRCTLERRFLVVRGDLRTYRIHLGSGNILMSPNDAYLCIVPGARRGEPQRDSRFRLPFEGDAMLSIIVSKALLLARDTAIDDPTIVRQIRGG